MARRNHHLHWLRKYQLTMSLHQQKVVMHDMHEMDEICICSQCNQHQATKNSLKKSPMWLFQHLCCNNDDSHPNLECFESDCKNSNGCGTSKLDQSMNSKLMTIDVNMIE